MFSTVFGGTPVSNVFLGHSWAVAPKMLKIAENKQRTLYVITIGLVISKTSLLELYNDMFVMFPGEQHSSSPVSFTMQQNDWRVGDAIVQYQNELRSLNSRTNSQLGELKKSTWNTHECKTSKNRVH